MPKLAETEVKVIAYRSIPGPCESKVRAFTSGWAAFELKAVALDSHGFHDEVTARTFTSSHDKVALSLQIVQFDSTYK